MSYRPDEKDFMDYLYGELEGQEKLRFERYVQEHPEAQKELQGLQYMQSALGTIKDKEVIAPPLVIGDTQQRAFWQAPYLRTVLAVAASLTLVLLVGRFSGLQMQVSDGEMLLSFGVPKAKTEPAAPMLTSLEIQQMIDAAMSNNNNALQANWSQSQAALDESVRKNLAANSGKISQLVQEVSSASQDQIREYVAGIQTQNAQLVKDYFQLTATDQKKHIENLLVDYAKYLQQQRTDDLKLVQTRLKNIEQHNDVFKQETEQILSSIITTVSAPSTATPKKESMY